MNFINSSKLLQKEIMRLLNEDLIDEAGYKYDQLEKIYEGLAKTLEEVKLLKDSCRSQIVEKLKLIRQQLDLIEAPKANLEDLQLLQTNESGLKEVSPGIFLSAISVSSDEFVPDTPLYFIRSSDEYCIKIQGCLIKGKLKDIVKDLKDPDTEFSIGNFMYTSEPLKKKNQHMRHIGSKSSLRSEIQNATRLEKKQRAEQLAHDLLVQLCINKLQNL